MTYLIVALSLVSRAAFASTQKIHCTTEQQSFNFIIRNAPATFSDDNDCYDSASASCRKFRKNVTGDEYNKIMELTLTTNLETRLYARGIEGTSVLLRIPNDRVGEAGAFKSHGEICIQDCVAAIFNCTSTIQ